MHKKIAVVGCGYWGKNLVRNFFELGVLECISDPDTNLATKLSKEFGVKNLNYDQVINSSEIDAVVLAVPADLHASMAIKAMEKGKHIYVEKPLALNEIEARKMIDTSIKNSVHLMVGHLLQYHPVFSKLKEINDAGHLGKLDYLYSNRLSFGKFRTHEDVIWSFAPHDISMILSITKQQPLKIHTHQSSILQKNIADVASIHLEFPNNLKGHISVSWLHPFKEQKLVVIGSKKMAVFDDTMDWEKKLAIFNHKIIFSENTPIPQKAEPEYIKIPYAEPLKEECKYFINLLENKVKPLTDGVEGLKVLQVLSQSSSYN